MLEEPILTVAFIVAVTAFIKTQLGLSGWKAMLIAFLVALVVGLVPVFVATFPVVAPWLTALVNVIVLFLTAAGSYDFIMSVKRSE